LKWAKIFVLQDYMLHIRKILSYKNLKSIIHSESILIVNPWNHRKKSSAKAPEPIYRLFLNVVYRKLKVVEAPITFAIGS
jgi:hypothetical protein